MDLWAHSEFKVQHLWALPIRSSLGEAYLSQIGQCLFGPDWAKPIQQYWARPGKLKRKKKLGSRAWVHVDLSLAVNFKRPPRKSMTGSSSGAFTLGRSSAR